jgi:hypothetical protein
MAMAEKMRAEKAREIAYRAPADCPARDADEEKKRDSK